ncbi:alpha-glucosidase [Lactiplantibacillus argentoratensis]|uniref:glycoside hydrolase family 13 protein n=1 Tax=Lactiplantibacillus argentoratensis TaxID=271881 RepID=UPI001CE0C738|nr:alpha-glucosidase [Lactiplantibacillus argentoratensis]MCA5597184.1 alpha-glucosidase [Lactiplantibacillus argentoratensis]
MQAHWWQRATVYQIYPRSFQDSNGDGIGDIPGIISRLDYLTALGVDALWLSPVYKSPNADNGYDIADYQAIDPAYGTMADMDQLIAQAAQRGIKIVMDLVVNHTSDEHPWFVDARQNPDSPTRDYYVWADAVDGHVPNDLTSGFIGGSAWELDKPTGQYFLHLFSKKQIDLNWQNPDLRRAIYRMMNFWIDKGIEGFRMDVIDMIAKEPRTKVLVNGPHLHEYLHEMNRQTWRNRDFLTVGEAWSASPEDARQYSDERREELSMVFQFGHLWADRRVGGAKWEQRPLDVVQLKQALYACQTTMATHGWNSLFWSNHDLPRAVSRFGTTNQYRELSAKMLAIALHGLKGTPFVYQGEEIGMTDCPVATIDQVDDVEARTIYRQLRAQGDDASTAMRKVNIFNRDNARTPMQWTAKQQAGFTTGKPWLAINANYPRINVAAAQADHQSVWWTYQRLIRLRKQSPVLQQGEFTEISTVPAPVVAYTRTWQRNQWLICANFADTFITVDLPKRASELIISNYQDYPEQLGQVVLRPYEAFILALS